LYSLTGRSPFPMQPPSGGASLTAGGITAYTVSGPGVAFVELYANGASHVFTVSDSAVAQAIPAGQRVVYGLRAGAAVTVTA